MTWSQELLPEQLPAEPLPIVADWLAQAQRSGAQPNPNAMVLATVDRHGRPSARVVLCKAIQPRPGYVTFFTHYGSRKGLELADNPRAAAVMHWDRLRRQVRLEGAVVRATDAESDAYFASRPWQSRLGAWASRQSAPVGSRAELEQAMRATARRFGAPPALADDASHADDVSAPAPEVAIPRPPNWGGYHLWVDAVELWVEGPARLHDRARWQRELSAVDGSPERLMPTPWHSTRLQP